MIMWEKFKNSKSYIPNSFSHLNIKGTDYLSRDNHNMCIREEVYFNNLDWFKQ